MAVLAGGFVAVCSFVGLSAGIRVRLSIHRCIAPLVAASGIMLVLAFAAMLNVLAYACDALYLLGIASLVYAWGIKRSRPSGLLLLAMALYIAFFVWRLWGSALRHNDDYSHWGTIARFMLMRNRLPVESDGVLSHQSYPPATACFIYYFCHLFGFRASGCLVAQNFLHGVALLPLFSFIEERNRSRLYPIACLLTVTFLVYPCHDVDLLVDYMQAFFGIGIAAAILYYRNDSKRALISSLGAMAAVALFKNSGLYFSAISALLLFLTLRRKGVGKRAWMCGLAGILAPVIAYCLWMLRIHQSFPSGNMGNHSISIASFAEAMRMKGFTGVWAVAKGMLKAMLVLRGWHLGTVIVLLGALVGTLYIARSLPVRMRRNVRGASIFALGAFGLWLVMIFGMYVFSMSSQGAEQASSFTRYSASGYVYAAGLCCALFIFALQRKECPLPPALMRLGSAGSALILICMLALTFIPGDQTPVDKFIARSQEGTYVHNCLEDAQDRYGLPYGERCLVFYLYDDDYYLRRYGYTRNNIVYQFGTGDCRIVSAHRETPDSLRIGNQPAEPSEVRDYIAESVGGGCTAVILLDESPAFEAALEPVLAAGSVDIPVCREYEQFSYDGKRRPDAPD